MMLYFFFFFNLFLFRTGKIKEIKITNASAAIIKTINMQSTFEEIWQKHYLTLSPGNSVSIKKTFRQSKSHFKVNLTLSKLLIQTNDLLNDL